MARWFADTRRTGLTSSLSLALLLSAAACGDDGEKSDKDNNPSVTGDAGGTPGADAGAGTADAGGAISADGLTVEFSSGKVKGKLVGATREFLGIPYAKAERFSPAKAVERWDNELDASKHGPSCLQAMGALSPVNPAGNSDDCLSINVYSPSTTPAGGLPVHVFIHGGAFTSGGSVQYDGQKLSERGQLVVITLNYRLGPFGFLSHPDLAATRGGVPTGNDGIRDQQLALKWIKSNVAAFGGDPKKVTVSGESAGAMSACLHMVSPGSLDLAQRFVLESGVCTSGASILKPKADGDKLGKSLTDMLCVGQTDLLACLRGKAVPDVAGFGSGAGLTGAGWAPQYDASDALLPDHPQKLIQDGKYNKGAVVLGSNAREWGLFQLLGSPSPQNVAALDTAIDTQLGATLGAAGAPLVKAHYKPATDADANPAFIRLMTDSAFRCAARAFARLVTSKGSKAYLYHFDQGQAFHAFEIPYVFGNTNPTLGAAMLDEPTVTAVQGYWAQFATTGDPNGKVQPAWPAYDATSDQHLTLKSAPEVGSALSKADCDFWDTLTAAAK